MENYNNSSFGWRKEAQTPSVSDSPADPASCTPQAPAAQYTTPAPAGYYTTPLHYFTALHSNPPPHMSHSPPINSPTAPLMHHYLHHPNTRLIPPPFFSKPPPPIYPRPPNNYVMPPMSPQGGPTMPNSSLQRQVAVPQTHYPSVPQSAHQTHYPGVSQSEHTHYPGVPQGSISATNLTGYHNKPAPPPTSHETSVGTPPPTTRHPTTTPHHHLATTTTLHHPLATTSITGHQEAASPIHPLLHHHVISVKKQQALLDAWVGALGKVCEEPSPLCPRGPCPSTQGLSTRDSNSLLKVTKELRPFTILFRIH